MSTATTQPSHVLKERIAELEAQLERVQIGAEMEMAALGSQVAQMKRENDGLKARLADRAKEITKRDRELYMLWLEVHGKDGSLKINAFGPAAQSALSRARKAGLEQEDMERVVRAHARFPFLVFGQWRDKGSAKDRKDLLSHAFKSEERWNALLTLADTPPSPHVPQKQNYEEHLPGYGYGRPVQNVYAALERFDCNPYLSASGQGSANCPIHEHDDRQKSFRFKEDDKGGVLMYCHACSTRYVTGEAFCDQVRQDIDLPLTDMYPNQRS